MWALRKQFSLASACAPPRMHAPASNPSRGVPPQNCDVTETTNTGATIYSFNNARKGVSPCRLQIRNDGSLAIFDSLNNLLSVNAQPARPVASSGQILTGQAAQDVRPLPPSRCDVEPMNIGSFPSGVIVGFDLRVPALSGLGKGLLCQLRTLVSV